MEKDELLNILERLENYRKRIEENPQNAGCIDHVIRMCEAQVAHGTFETRMEWTELLKNKV